MSPRDAQILEQAREIYHTVHLLKNTLSRRFLQIRGESPLQDLTMPQCNALSVIRERGAMTMKELADALQVSPPSVSAMVERLCDMGMVVREPSQIDRREVRVRIAAQGEESLTMFEAHMLESIAELVEKVGPETAEAWCAVYSRLREVVEEASAAEATASTQ